MSQTQTLERSPENFSPPDLTVSGGTIIEGMSPAPADAPVLTSKNALTGTSDVPEFLLAPSSPDHEINGHAAEHQNQLNNLAHIATAEVAPAPISHE